MSFKGHKKQWFRNRIGKTIYRKKLHCACSVCQNGEVFIRDTSNDPIFRGNPYFHADYIWDCSAELGIDYFDKPVEDKDGIPRV